MTLWELVACWTLIWLCLSGIGVAVVGWMGTELATARDNLLRQEVREELAQAHPAMQSSIVFCEKHSVVGIDFCPDCRVDEFVALTRPGYVVHS